MCRSRRSRTCLVAEAQHVCFLGVHRGASHRHKEAVDRHSTGIEPIHAFEKCIDPAHNLRGVESDEGGARAEMEHGGVWKEGCAGKG